MSGITMVSADRICGFHALRRGLFFVYRIGDIRVIRSQNASSFASPLFMQASFADRGSVIGKRAATLMSSGSELGPLACRSIAPGELIYRIGQVTNILHSSKPLLIALTAALMSEMLAAPVGSPANARFARSSRPDT